MQHIQMHAVRNHLSSRGMAIRLDNGDYVVSHKDEAKWPTQHTYGDLESAYFGGLKMASQRDCLNDILRGI